MAVRAAGAHPQACQHLGDPIPPEGARVHTNVFPYSYFNLPVIPLYLPVGAGVPRRSLADSDTQGFAEAREHPFEFLTSVDPNPLWLAVLRQELPVEPISQLLGRLRTKRPDNHPLCKTIDAH